MNGGPGSGRRKGDNYTQPRNSVLGGDGKHHTFLTRQEHDEAMDANPSGFKKFVDSSKGTKASITGFTYAHDHKNALDEAMNGGPRPSNFYDAKGRPYYKSGSIL